TTLKSGCSDVLDFYVMEAETKVPQLVDFYLKKEKFEKLKIAMDKKGKNSSNEEINEFNTAVNDYNKSINDYNAVNNDLNKKRSEALETWNNAVSKFLDKNVSKKK
ncbi:MAG: LIC11966 family surface protein, partial [Bacteroidia bacterium]